MCVGEPGEWGRVRWIRSDSCWLWPDSFKGGWGQKLDHSGPKRDGLFPGGLSGRLENDGAAQRLLGGLSVYKAQVNLRPDWGATEVPEWVGESGMGGDGKDFKPSVAKRHLEKDRSKGQVWPW